MARTGRFTFDGGPSTYFGTLILSVIIVVFTLGIGYPFSFVLRERWKAKHTYIDGKQLRFTGTGTGLFGLWIKWWLLTIVTLGIYLLWVPPRLEAWRVEHLNYAHGYADQSVRAAMLSPPAPRS